MHLARVYMFWALALLLFAAILSVGGLLAYYSDQRAVAIACGIVAASLMPFASRTGNAAIRHKTDHHRRHATTITVKPA